jgi:hypothetical protein
MLEVYLAILDEAYYEVKMAFDGLAVGNVWKRPAPGLLSVGELAGHMAYWESVKFAGNSDKPDSDPQSQPVRSLLLDRRFRYYSSTLDTAPTAEHLAMTAQQVCDELLRVHKESFAIFKETNVDLDAHPPGWPEPYTYRAFLTYASFHVAYHTGQIYTVRHLLGEETTDN